MTNPLDVAASVEAARDHAPIIPELGRQMCEDNCPEYAVAIVRGPTPAQDLHLCAYHARVRNTFFAHDNTSE